MGGKGCGMIGMCDSYCVLNKYLFKKQMIWSLREEWFGADNFELRVCPHHRQPTPPSPKFVFFLGYEPPKIHDMQPDTQVRIRTFCR